MGQRGPRPNVELDKQIVALRQLGWSGSKIGDELNVTANRIFKAVRRQQAPRRRRHVVTECDEIWIIQQRRLGRFYVDIAAELGCSLDTIKKVMKRTGGIAPRLDSTSSRHLCLEDREEISRGLVANKSVTEIAEIVKRSPSTVCREIQRNGGRANYRASAAHQRAHQMMTRPKPTKLAANEVLRALVSEMLKDWFSPELIARRLKAYFPGQISMQISHEAIYQALYVQGRGELKKELHQCLRTGRAKRKPRGRVPSSGTIANKFMISERPPEVEDRAVPGHWEGDLIIGKDGKSAVATLVERSSRYVMLCKIPDKTAEVVARALANKVSQLPTQLKRTLTWDQGTEMAAHETFSVATDVDVYFCDPHSPWQRGSNENTNGLLRQYMPKGSDLSLHSQEALDAMARHLNSRPRLTLGDRTPAAVLDEFIALTG